jgi:hypothetical protein
MPKASHRELGLPPVDFTLSRDQEFGFNSQAPVKAQNRVPPSGAGSVKADQQIASSEKSVG